jgi:hypothetical protein
LLEKKVEESGGGGGGDTLRAASIAEGGFADSNDQFATAAKR